jgi:glycerol-3-phosphate dehydrogenase
MNIVLLGSGNIATQLGRAFKMAGQNIVQVWSRNIDHARELADTLASEPISDLFDLDTTADLYIIAVKDEAIKQLAHELKVNDKLIVHTNLGWLKDKQTNQQQMTYGVGSELQTSNRMIVIAEIFGDNKTKPYWQTGARYSLIPNLLQLDATIGQQFDHGTSTRWISFGLRYVPDSLF